MTGTTSIIAQSYAARRYHAAHHDACRDAVGDSENSLIQYIAELLACADPTVQKLPGSHNTCWSSTTFQAATVITSYTTSGHLRDTFQALTFLAVDGGHLTWTLYPLPGADPELTELMIQALDDHETLRVREQTLDDLVTAALATTDPSQLHEALAAHLPCDGPHSLSPDPEILADLLAAMTQAGAMTHMATHMASARRARSDTVAAGPVARSRLALINSPRTPPRSATHAVLLYLPGLSDTDALDVAGQLNHTHYIDHWIDHQSEPRETRKALQRSFTQIWESTSGSPSEALAQCHLAVAEFHPNPHEVDTEARTVVAYNLQTEACREDPCT